MPKDVVALPSPEPHVTPEKIILSQSPVKSYGTISDWVRRRSALSSVPAVLYLPGSTPPSTPSTTSIFS